MMNPHIYRSAEDRDLIEKKKFKMKKYFIRFFKKHEFKKFTMYYKKWVAYVEFCKTRGMEYATVQKFIKARDTYYQALHDEKQRQMSRDLLNGFKSLNMNKLKQDAEEGSESEEEAALNETAEAKKQEKGGFQNFVPLEPSKKIKKHKLFQDVFLIYKQQLRDDGI